MKEAEYAHVEGCLQNVPDGVIQVIGEPFPESSASPLEIQTVGRGKLCGFCPLPGIEMTFFHFLGGELPFRREKPERTIQILHCRLGRCVWNVDGDLSAQLSPGGLAIAHCADTHLTLPLAYGEGLLVTLELSRLAESLPPLLWDAGVDIARLQRTFCVQGTPWNLPACPEAEQLFAALYDAPAPTRQAYCHLKAQELLLFLARLEAEHGEAMDPCRSQQMDVIREVHALLTENLRQRYTIEELSKRYLLNTTTLKTLFKTAFGQPIGAYMKTARAREAARLLRETDAAVGEIAAAVGYESQGKFAKAFHDEWGILPTEYRKQYQTAPLSQRKNQA